MDWSDECSSSSKDRGEHAGRSSGTVGVTEAQHRVGEVRTDGGVAQETPRARSIASAVTAAAESLLSSTGPREDPIILLNPSQETLRQTIRLLWEAGPELVAVEGRLIGHTHNDHPEGLQGPVLHVVAGEYCLDSVLGESEAGLQAADLAGGGLELTKATVDCPGPLLVTPDYSIGFVKIGGCISQLAAPGEQTGALYQAAASLVEEAPRHETDIVGWDELHQSFADSFGAEAARFMRQLIISGENKDVFPAPLDLVGVALVTACVKGLPLDEIVSWGNQVGIGGKAVFTQIRRELVDDSAFDIQTDAAGRSQETEVGSLDPDEAWGWTLKPDGDWHIEKVAEYAARTLG